VDSLLHPLGSLGYAWLAVGVVVSFLVALAMAIFRAVRSVENEFGPRNPRVGPEFYSRIGKKGGERGRGNEEAPPRSDISKKPAREESSSMRALRTALRDEIDDAQRKSFWPTFWLNLGTNFLTNLFFFILGIAVTLLLSQAH
jgi:hypothetical protein